MSTNLFWGYSGENILGPLYKDLLARNSEIIGVDPTRDRIPDLRGVPTNFLTSNHFTRTKSELNDLYPELGVKHDYYAIRRAITFSNLFFFLHDHSELLVLDEPSAISDYNVVVSPWPVIHKGIGKAEVFCCDIAFKNINEYEQYVVERKAVWLVSNIKFNVERHGIEGFANEILRVIDGCEVALKFPEYGQISASLEKYLLKSGADVIPNSQSSQRVVLEAEKVISSSFSGIGALARYYDRDLIVVANSHPTEFSSTQSLLSDYASWLGNPPIIDNSEQMKAALSKPSNRLSVRRHRCGVFRDDFIEKFSRELFLR